MLQHSSSLEITELQRSRDIAMQSLKSAEARASEAEMEADKLGDRVSQLESATVAMQVRRCCGWSSDLLDVCVLCAPSRPTRPCVVRVRVVQQDCLRLEAEKRCESDRCRELEEQVARWVLRCELLLQVAAPSLR
jgi:hypothetical protein